MPAAEPPSPRDRLSVSKLAARFNTLESASSAGWAAANQPLFIPIVEEHDRDELDNLIGAIAR